MLLKLHDGTALSTSILGPTSEEIYGFWGLRFSVAFGMNVMFRLNTFLVLFTWRLVKQCEDLGAAACLISRSSSWCHGSSSYNLTRQ